MSNQLNQNQLNHTRTRTWLVADPLDPDQLEFGSQQFLAQMTPNSMVSWIEFLQTQSTPRVNSRQERQDTNISNVSFGQENLSALDGVRRTLTFTATSSTASQTQENNTVRNLTHEFLEPNLNSVKF